VTPSYGHRGVGGWALVTPVGGSQPSAATPSLVLGRVPPGATVGGGATLGVEGAWLAGSDVSLDVDRDHAWAAV
jgi:hypothetical protein